jgi:hypothetical protein
MVWPVTLDMILHTDIQAAEPSMKHQEKIPEKQEG